MSLSSTANLKTFVVDVGQERHQKELSIEIDLVVAQENKTLFSNKKFSLESCLLKKPTFSNIFIPLTGSIN